PVGFLPIFTGCTIVDERGFVMCACEPLSCERVGDCQQRHPLRFQETRNVGNRFQRMQIVWKLLKYWTNFAKCCNPNGEQSDPKLPAWPLFKNENSRVMVLTGEGPHPAPVPSEAAMKVLDEYFAWRRSQE
ncbi:MAG: carboxylesterase family protein, partial [Bacteroidaceae bacterium]|nr:carboxylesterase family protein [Bacteroidaceae bacterium]